MAFAYTGGNQNTGNSASISVAHGQTINAGDLVVAYVNINGPPATLTADDPGWTTALDETNPGAETSRHALFWMIAPDGSEPATYTWTISTGLWVGIVSVFTSAATPEVDAAVNSHIKPSVNSTGAMECGAADSEVISDNALSIICGGKDNSSSGTELYTQADNSYTGVLGDSVDRSACMAHRIYTTGTTFSGYINITTADSDDAVSDLTYSMHISFVEAGGGAATPHSPFGLPFNGPFTGPIS